MTIYHCFLYNFIFQELFILHLCHKAALSIPSGNFYTLVWTFGEGSGIPLQYSCLENPMYGGAWWAAVHGVADTTEWLHFHFSLSCIGEGNDNRLQCSFLENPRDGGAWWAAVCGVTQSWIWLKWLSSSSDELIKWQPRGSRDVLEK